jgi:transposase
MTRRKQSDKAAYLDFTLDVVCGLQRQIAFQVQPRRWVVERAFAWLMRYRRLVRDYEQQLDVSDAMIYIALDSSLLHRIRFR